MKNLIWGLLILLMASCAKKADNTITISGKVKFPDNNFKMMIYQRDGFDKVIIDSFQVNKDNTYSYTMNVKNPGVYTLDCQKWQMVNFWAEDENLEIDFRGQDTAKMKIKNPPFVYIKGGESNEVMNLLNYNSYRDYQLMIGLSQAAYHNLSKVPEYGPMIGDVYSVLGDDSKARTRYIAERYADRNSVIAAINFLNPEKDKDIIEKALSRLEAKNPNYAPLVKYKKDKAEAKAAKERLALGKLAPDFSYPTPDGKNISPRDFKGNYLLIDFWASWCGPCRSEIPNVDKLYNEYKDKGLAVLSVSIDKSKKDWLKALDEENMSWPQVNAPKSGKQIMKDYQFSGIPYIILLDKDGKIIAKGLRGEQMHKKVEELLK